jgi:hypothetical protein
MHFKNLIIELGVVEIILCEDLRGDTFISKQTCPFEQLLSYCEVIHHFLFCV